MSTNWLIPFKGKNCSGHSNLNFLWQSDSTYIMDNHLAALWCWLQHISKDRKYNFLHIDRHYDTRYSHIEEWKENLPNISKISINEYLDAKWKYETQDIPLFVCDNYLSIFLDCYKEKIKKCFFATHEAKSEEKPIFNNLQEIKIWDVPNIIDNLFTDEKQKWIINVDIDYFFCEDKLAGDSQLLMLSDDYIANIFEPLANQIKKDTISVFTLCLSPELSSGWDNSYEICTKICEILELDFSLDLKN